MVLFVSKKVTHQALLHLVEKRNVRLIDQSMISFCKADFKCPKYNQYETVFFSSPRSVHYFLERCKIQPTIKIGCIGRSTEVALHKYEITPDFVGIKSGDPAEVAIKFKTFVGDNNVLFPQSDRSHRSMQRQLKNEKTINLVVYQTLLEPKRLSQKPDILVFTSPSNCEAFLQSNEISQDQKVIAWGSTTEQFLIDNNVNVHQVLTFSTFTELTLLLKELI